MKPLIKLLRIAVLAACAFWLVPRTPGVHAQSIIQCYTYDSEVIDPCNNCCSPHPELKDASEGEILGLGYEVLSMITPECGSATGSCTGGTNFTGCAPPGRCR